MKIKLTPRNKNNPQFRKQTKLMDEFVNLKDYKPQTHTCSLLGIVLCRDNETRLDYIEGDKNGPQEN